MSSSSESTHPAAKPPASHENVTLPPPVDGSETAPYVPASTAGARPLVHLPATFGRYQLRKLLGQGGMGAVYLAHDTQLDRPVALKVPHFQADDSPQVRERFYREARAAATVTHPNICPVYDVGEIEGAPYLTMAFIEGKSLAEFVRARPLTPRQSAMLVRKLALALAEAHKRGVIHRDLKPANVMIDKRGEPMIMDFGLARRVRAGDVRLTQKGDMLGTPAYMPPEQVSGDVEAMGPACDIYSLGVILYELLAGRLPFSGDAMAMLSQVLLDVPPPPSKFQPQIDAGLSSICLKAMAKKPEGRYASMSDFAAALLGYLRGTSSAPAAEASAPAKPAAAEGDLAAFELGGFRSTTQAHQQQPIVSPRRKQGKSTRRAPRSRPRSPWPWIVGGVVAAAGGLLAAVFFLLPREKPPHSTESPTRTTAATQTIPPAPSRPKPADNQLVQKGEPADGFTPLFKGKDFTGWQPADLHRDAWDDVWRVDKGEMAFRVIDPSKQRGWLLTERDYSDFLLRFEFRLGIGSNSGVALRTWPGAAKCVEIQLQDDSFHGFRNQGPIDRTGALYGVAIDRPAELKKLGEWNRVEIELRGWSLRVAVNDKETLRTKLNSNEVFRYLKGAPNASGRIGLQHWLGSARFRKVEVKELR